MRKLYALFSAISCCILPITHVSAQSSVAISGTVNDNKGKAISHVTVSLLTATDSTLVKADVTSDEGRFDMQAAPGQYLLLCTSVGYQKKYSRVFTLYQSYDTLLVMEPSGKKLQEIAITSVKPMIEVKADKTIFNVEGSINAQGSNALELLQKSPGIRVDNNDNISMRGKNGVKIYVDGKMTQLEAKDLAAYLKSINSNDIEAIEIISNPSAKYDASGNAGIINLRLKKNKKYGTNGSVNAGFTQGVTPKANGSINLNYRDKLINLFGNAGIDRGNYHNTQNLYRIQSDSLFDQKSSSIYQNRSYNVKAGADYFINKKNTFGILISGNVSNSEWDNNSRAVISYTPTGEYVKTLMATNAVPGRRVNMNNNINYRYIDTSGKEINIDADYGLFRGKGRSFQPNYYLDASGTLLYSIINRNNTPTDIDIYTAKADIELPKWKGKLGYGVKGAYVKTRNAFEFFTDQNGQTVKNNERSNRFQYVENVNAAYINYSRQLNKDITIQAGIRAEQTNSEGILTRDDGLQQADNDIRRSYLDFFPSAALTYVVDKKNTLNLTYSRRIDRPSYQDLNPFENKLDELTYEKGNAFLKPQYTDNIELSHLWMGIITTTAGYSHVKDYRAQFLDTTNKNATFVQQRNLATQQIFSLNISSSLPIAKWWNGYVNIYGTHQKYNGRFTNQQIDLKVTGYGGYIQNTFTLGHNYTAEVSGWLNGPGIDGSLRFKTLGAADIGFQKQFMQKRASLKISATDILHTARFRALSDFKGLYLKAWGHWESQTVRVNFTYRFGSNEISSSRERKTGLETEAGRIKAGK